MEKHVPIREAGEDDLAAVFEFVCELEEQVFDFDIFKTIYLTNIEDADNIYLVATDEHLPIGYISCHGQLLLHHGGKVFEIQELFVKKEYRGKRIGERLIKALESRLTSMGCVSLEVTTNRDRNDTIRFYQKCGFNQSHVKFTKSIHKQFRWGLKPDT